MGVRADYVGVDERGAAALTAILHGVLAGRVTFQRVGAVALGNMQAWKASRQLGNAAAGRLYLDGNRDGVTVVFDEVEQRELFRTGDIERFPELPFAGGAVAGRDVNDLVGIMADVFPEGGLLGLRESFRAGFEREGG